MLTMRQMPYHLGLVVKFYPNYRQKRLVAVNDGAKRAVYNHLVACGNERYLLAKTMDYVPSDRARIDYLDSVTEKVSAIQNVMPFLYSEEVDSQAVANAKQNYHSAWSNMRKLHTGVPTFKKKSYTQSYQTNPHYKKNKEGGYDCNVRFEDRHHVTLPKLGRVRFSGSPKLVDRILEKFEKEENVRIGAIKVSRDAVGEYWLSFQLGAEKPFREEMPKTGKMHGIDLNLIDLVNDSEGSASKNMRFYEQSMEKLAKGQRILSRRREHAKKEEREFYESKGYQEQRQKVAKLHRKTARQREDYLHNLSKREIENQDLIAAEDLKVKKLLHDNRLSRAISDASWRKFLTMLQYKADLYGKEVILVPPEYTTQTCSHCGYVLRKKESLSLADREWTCPKCGTYHHRDTNAAKVILSRALEISPRNP